MPLIPTISGLRILSSTKNFTVRYSVTGQVLALFHFINNPFNPIRNKLLAKYKRQEQEFVLIVNTTKKSLSTKACVRVNIARRIRELVLAELREQGWGRDGSVIGPKTPKGVGIPQDGGFPRYPLKGCLAFFPYEESVTTPVEVLRKEVKQGVERFLTKHEEARIAALELQLRKLHWQEESQSTSASRRNNISTQGRGSGGDHDHGQISDTESYKLDRRGDSSDRGWSQDGRFSSQQQSHVRSQSQSWGQGQSQRPYQRDGPSGHRSTMPSRGIVDNKPGYQRGNDNGRGNYQRGDSRPAPSFHHSTKGDMRPEFSSPSFSRRETRPAASSAQFFKGDTGPKSNSPSFSRGNTFPAPTGDNLQPANQRNAPSWPISWRRDSRPRSGSLPYSKGGSKSESSPPSSGGSFTTRRK